MYAILYYDRKEERRRKKLSRYLFAISIGIGIGLTRIVDFSICVTLILI